MDRNQKPVKSVVSAAIVAIMCSQAAYSGSFALYTESSASKIGNFAAGSAAEADDASTAWYNPAGLVLLKKQQAVFSGVGVFPSTKLTGTSTYNTTVTGLGRLPAYQQSFTNVQGADDGFVPAFHYALPLGERAAFGFSIVAPYGLSTTWEPTSALRYSATSTQLTTIDISPDIAGKITDNISFGMGMDFQWAKVRFNGLFGSPSFLQASGSSPTSLDSLSNNQGHSHGFGLHAGFLGTFNNDHTRLGLNYQSEVNHKFYGYSTLTGPLASPGFVNPNASFRSYYLNSNQINLPGVLTLSGYHDINDKVAVLASVLWTGWHSFKNLEINKAATGPSTYSNIEATEDYRDTIRAAVGVNYRFCEQWMLRLGAGYDETPTINAQRDIRIADANRWAVSIGSHYQPRADIGIDVGYTYLFATDRSPVNKTTITGGAPTASNNVINATARDNASLVGLQVDWTIDQPKVSGAVYK